MWVGAGVEKACRARVCGAGPALGVRLHVHPAHIAPCPSFRPPPPHTPVPWLTKLANSVIQGRLGEPAAQAALARDAVDNLERLGPTFIKLGQIMSIR